MNLLSIGSVVAALTMTTTLAAQQAAAPAPATAPAAPPCQGAEYRTLDFWAGDWVAYDQAGKAIGTNRITRDEYGDCVITEHFKLNDGTLTGHSVSIYRPAIKQWRQNWVDSQGSYFDLIGGPVSSGDHIFVFETKRVSETQTYQRMIWQDVKADSFIWRWQKRAKPTDEWVDSWVINYKRKT
jgi:hypothetical protein